MIRLDIISVRVGRRGINIGMGDTSFGVVCFADTDWNLYGAENWNNINTNWNNCL